MRAMAAALLPSLLPEQPALATRRVLAAGLTEATAGEAIADLMEHAGPHREDLRVGITASLGVLSITVRGNDAQAVARTEQEVRRRLGPAVFGGGDQTLAGAVVAALAERGLTLTTAESCTGGLLAGAITSVPGSSAVFREGLVTYGNEAKTTRLDVGAELLAREGAVSEPVALAMARGARARAQADLAVAISGIAGPDGGTPDKPVGTVVIALCDARGERALTFHWKGTRDELRARSVSVALDLVRRRLPPGRDGAAGSPG
jgi:nicotinamide-nucleotide amidase